MSADTLLARAALDRATAQSAIASAQLVSLRGIGTQHARRLYEPGVRSVCGLAGWPPGDLWVTYQQIGKAASPAG